MKNTYQQNKIGKTVAWVLAAIILVAAVGAVFVVLKSKEKQSVEKTNYQEGMVMTAVPTIRLSEPAGIRFTAQITPELYNEVINDKNKTFGIVLAPVSYFTAVAISENNSDCNWIKSFKDEELKVLNLETVTPMAITEPDGTIIEYRINGVISNVLYKNTNLQFLGVGYIKTTNGDNVEYKYASFPDALSYKQCAYSYAYVAAERINSYIVLNEHLAQSDIDLLKGVINNSVDLANGLSEATDDGSIYAVTLSEVSKTMSIGEEFKLKVDIAEGVKVPVWWQSSNSTVATVNNGVIKAVGKGTATVSAIIAGEKYTCTVTVNEFKENSEIVE